jgi:hypothetical protein
MKKETYELSDLTDSEVPADVREIVLTHGDIITAKRFAARNWRKKIHSGFVFTTSKDLVVIIESNRKLLGKPAWGVSVMSDSTIEKAIDGRFCHTAITVSFFGHNIAVKS